MDHNKNAVAIFNKHAAAYANKFMDVSLYGNSFDFFCAQLTSENASVLEIACGPGNITRYLLDKLPDLKILGSDLSENMISIAKQNNPEAKFELLDGRGIGKLNTTFDGIMCGFCLPYFSKEETFQFFADAFRVLNPDGVIYISTMEDDYSKSGFRKGSQGDEIFMHYHEEEYLRKELLRIGFEILNRERVESIMTDGSKVIDLIMIAKK